MQQNKLLVTPEMCDIFGILKDHLYVSSNQEARDKMFNHLDNKKSISNISLNIVNPVKNGMRISFELGLVNNANSIIITEKIFDEQMNLLSTLTINYK